MWYENICTSFFHLSQSTCLTDGQTDILQTYRQLRHFISYITFYVCILYICYNCHLYCIIVFVFVRVLVYLYFICMSYVTNLALWLQYFNKLTYLLQTDSFFIARSYCMQCMQCSEKSHVAQSCYSVTGEAIPMAWRIWRLLDVQSI